MSEGKGKSYDTVYRGHDGGASSTEHSASDKNPPPSNRVISVDTMTGGRIRANYFDNTWEIFDSNPATDWLVKAFEIERDANMERTARPSQRESIQFSQVRDPTNWNSSDEFDSLVFGSYTDAKKAEVLFNRLQRERDDAMKYGHEQRLKAALAARSSTRLKGDALYASHGYALATRVLQSDLYQQLDDRERAECDALVRGEERVSATEPSKLLPELDGRTK